MAVLNKSEMVGFRTTPVMKTLYREVAESQGVRISEWLRRLADQRVAELTRREADE